MCFGVIENFSYTSNCNKNKLPNILIELMKKREWNYNEIDWNYFFPCEYTTCEKSIKQLKNTKNKKIFMIDGCDVINSKVKLWNSLLEKYGRIEASTIMPNTFITRNNKDMMMFKKLFLKKKESNPNTKYIMKNRKQRQHGIMLTSNLQEILNGFDNGYDLVQEYVENPFLIDKRKVNFRRYLLIVCRNGVKEGYIHNDGFVYYTPKSYDEKSLDPAKNITTGYIDRSVYENNPLTVEDFRNYLAIKNQSFPIVFEDKVNKLFNKVINALHNKICVDNSMSSSILFQLFGADISLSDSLDVMLMEINKGPDIGAKDERDKQVKTKVIEDIIKIIENEPCYGFTQIY